MPIASAHLLSSYNRLQPKLLLKHVECQLRQKGTLAGFNFGFLSGIPRDCQPLYDYNDASISGKLSHAINELLVSEKSYVGSLHKIIEVSINN